MTSNDIHLRMLDTINHAVIATDLQFNITYINAAAIQLLNCHSDNILGRSLLDYAKPILPPEKLADIKNQLKINQSWCGELEIERHDGSRFISFSSDSAIQDNNNEVIGYIGTKIDISEQKEREAELLAMKKDAENNSRNLRRREAILAAVTVCAEYLLSDLNWRENINTILSLLGNAADASRAYIFEHRYEEDAIYSRQTNEWCKDGIDSELDNPLLVDFNLDTSELAYWKEIMLQGKSICGNIENMPEAEQELLAAQNIKSIVSIPIYVNDKWWGFIGFDQCETNRDWTDVEIDALKTAATMLGSAVEKSERLSVMHENEKKLIHYTKELEVSNQELEQFAYVASHDLQEPLRMISSFLTLLDKKYANQLDDKARSYIDFAVDGASRMRQIILDLLEFSRIGKKSEEIQRVNGNQLLTDAIRVLETVISENQAEIIVSSPLPAIFMNRTNLLQIFQNLISNAIKYRRKDVTPVITIKTERTDHWYTISFKDNGLGIPEEYHQRIFQIFQRLHNSTEYSGTGVGLAIVKKIMENLKGEIQLSSKLGKGSEFVLFFPLEIIDQE
jgi:PAS domain S-box-containing protein